MIPQRGPGGSGGFREGSARVPEDHGTAPGRVLRRFE